MRPVGCFPGFESGRSTPLCVSSSCSECRWSPENGTLHIDCFVLFKQDQYPSIVRDLAWTVVTWRQAWVRAPTLEIEPRIDWQHDINSIATLDNFQQLLELPEELKRMVRNYLNGSLWERYLRVHTLLGIIRPRMDQTLLLCVTDVRCWTRGGSLEIGSFQTDSLVQLTIDHRGLKSIAEYQEDSTSDHGDGDSAMYVVAEASDLAGAFVEFKVRGLRVFFVQSTS